MCFKELIRPLAFCFLIGITVFACSEEPSVETPQSSTPESVASPLFLARDASETGLNFSNNLQEDATRNYFTYEYMYNGGGVAIGDLNGDDLPDLILTGNSSDTKLYFNQGGLQFEEATATALPALPSPAWHSGVSLADLNGDGHLDIIICTAGPASSKEALRNLVFINQGNGTFTEQGMALGFSDLSYSTQSACFDYDLDGDLDVYVMNHYKTWDGLAAEGINYSDRFYRNDGSVFTDITETLGLTNKACGLGISVGDFNGDVWPDLYIANDYDEGDFLYINQGGQKFANEIDLRVKHISNFGMGTDLADINNDGFEDLIELDMAYADHVRSKRNMAAMSTEKFRGLAAQGQHYQYMSNTLQLNAGNYTYSEVAHLAGIAKTDWSWAPLLADFDNDGYKDLLVTNGYRRDVRDRDFQNNLEQKIAEEGQVQFEDLLSIIPTTEVPNKLYRNNGDLHFDDVSEDWGITTAFHSNGAAYADLDQDGDLDLVINNIDAPASLYENRASTGANQALQVKFDGPAGQSTMIGTHVEIETSAGKQVQTLMPTRGYQSAVEPMLHFGLAESTLEKITVTWPDGRKQVMTSGWKDGSLTLTGTSSSAAQPSLTSAPTLLRDITSQFPFRYQHQENQFDDFIKEILLPHMQSRNGPFVASGDLNGDGFDELFIGGAAGIAANLISQSPAGGLASLQVELWEAEKGYEDLGAIFFDANGDGHQDLYVVSGGNEFAPDDALLQDRLYLNDGNGNLSKASLPSLRSSGQCVVANDFDQDGDQDLFVGGRLVPGHYPQAAQSYLLINDGSGKFKDEAATRAPGFEALGMITKALWSDYDGDGDADLVTVGEWMTPQIWQNNDGSFTDVSEESGLGALSGWWFGLEEIDLGEDGQPDYLVGNLGLNHKFKTSAEHPFSIYGHDFDGNGSWDVVLSQYQDEKHYPVRGRECSSEQMPFIQEEFPSFEEFAVAEIKDLYAPEELAASVHYEAREFRSGILRNLGGGKFQFEPFPFELQRGPIQDFIVKDINGDGVKDILGAGNHYDVEVETVRHDAQSGFCMIGNKTGSFTTIPLSESGFFAPSNVRDMHLMALGPQQTPTLLVFNNRQGLQVFLFNSL